MNARLTWLVLLASCAAAWAQEKPKPKKVPLYKIVMTCPRGEKLYVRQQTGMRPLGLGDASGNFEFTYKWYEWDGEQPVWSSVAASAACFKVPPTESGK